jgi:quercetin dioxygenase-like cupin family protein
MWRQRALATLVLILALILPLGAAAEDPPGPTTRVLTRVDGLPLDGVADVVHQVNDFAPGAQTSVHSHPGLIITTVLAGDLIYHNPAGDRPFTAGESFVEQPDVVHFGRNPGTAPTRIVSSFVIAKGATLTTPAPTQPSPAPQAPTTPYLVRVPAVVPVGAYEVAQGILDFVPGAQTPLHTYSGQVVTTVLEGALTFTSAGETKTYAVGESFAVLPDVVSQARNAGTVPATVVVTFLLPKGAPLLTPVATPGLPATGAGGMAHRSTAAATAALFGALLFAAGWALRRRRSRA